MVTIYGVYDASGLAYIGMTNQKLSNRAKSGASHYRSKGLEPVLIPLEQVADRLTARRRERELIQQLQPRGNVQGHKVLFSDSVVSSFT